MARLSAASTNRRCGAGRATCLAATALACSVSGGCSKSPYELAPTSGVVVIDGQPFTQGKVMFAPIAVGESRESGKPAFGRLGADGSFTLSTYEEGDGAVVGEHWVTVIREKAKNDEPSPPKAIVFSRVRVPRKVSVVAGQDNRVDIAISRQEIAQYGILDD